jgi:hypothetical protein
VESETASVRDVIVMSAVAVRDPLCLTSSLVAGDAALCLILR